MQSELPLEKELEDWICENIERVADHSDAELVGRQIWTPHGGRLDVLAARPGRDTDLWEWVVIEVKREEADLSALNQLMRYMGSVVHADTIIRWSPWVSWREYAVKGKSPTVSGILAAPSFSDQIGQAIHAFGSKLGTYHLELSEQKFDPFPIPETPDLTADSSVESWRRSVRGAVTRLMVRRGHAG